jgi:asparagine synthase (glutamine-hydrolysing)
MLLHYEDRNSMAFSVESRVPFLTPALATFILSLPDDYLVAVDGTSKAVFRQAMRGIVPDKILDRRDKVGIPTRERDWLMAQRPFVERTLNGEGGGRIAALSVNSLLQEWEKTVQGRQQLDSRTWRWLNLILWAQKFSATAA